MMGKIANNQIKAKATSMRPKIVKLRLHPFHIKLTLITSFIFQYKIYGIEAFYPNTKTFASLLLYKALAIAEKVVTPSYIAYNQYRTLWRTIGEPFSSAGAKK
jgi:hypothetical protein